jgi:hypothetical protein
MSTEETDITRGLKKIAYLRKERTIILCLSMAAMFGMFFLIQPTFDETTENPLIGLVVSVVGAAIIFNTIRFVLTKCPRCRSSFNGYSYLVGIRRGNALDCTSCGLSLRELQEFKPTYKSGGQDQW